jgi:hypothetical protein
MSRSSAPADGGVISRNLQGMWNTSRRKDQTPILS